VLGQYLLLTAEKDLLGFPNYMLSEQKRRAAGRFLFILQLFYFSYLDGKDVLL